jgi:hypothetical protein
VDCIGDHYRIEEISCKTTINGKREDYVWRTV